MNLATKIILSILCVLILSMGGLTYLITRWQTSMFGESAHHYAKVLGETICDSIATEMEIGRSDLVQGTLQRIGEGSSQIRSLRIIDRNGQILRSVNPEEVGRRTDVTLLRNHLRDVSMLFEHRMNKELLVSFVRPFPNRSPCQRCHDPKKNIIAFLVLDVSIKPLEELVSSTRRFVLEGAGITLLMVVGIILSMTSRWVQAPLSKVIGAMKKVEEGDLDARAPLTSRDELGRVARTFNSMVERLKRNKEDLEVLHQRELERTQRMATLGELAGSVAHEIRNPIAGVSAAVQIVRKGLRKDDPWVEIFDEICFQADRIEKVVSNLVQFARKSSPQFSFCNIHEIIEKTFSLFSFQFRDQDVSIEREFQSNLPQIYGDPEQIQQVLMNILLNAIQAMPEGGRLGLKTFFRPEDGMVHLTIGDTGKGISEDMIPMIFKPFYSTKAKGAGMGLAIVEKIVQEHGGKVAIFSEAEVGTTVEILLPAKPPSDDREIGGNDRWKTDHGMIGNKSVDR